MIPVKLEQLFLSNMGFVLILKGDKDPRALPIFIGATEAQSIALWLNKVELPRPMTHDLMKSILDCVECRVQRVVISDLDNGTFYAKIVIDSSGAETEVDSRPSDAIALALRTNSPIYVDDSVMEKAGRVIESEDKSKKAEEKQEKKTDEEKIKELKEEIRRAIEEERYEDAAKIRDQIKVLRHSHTKN